MALQTRWIQSVQRWPITSLQTKATLLVIAIVAGVLSLSTLLNIRVSEHALERDPPGQCHRFGMAICGRYWLVGSSPLNRGKVRW
jgi:hypothetical protein